MKLVEAFAFLNSINCNDHTEKKNGLTYLSWAWAWQILKTHFPLSYYTIYERDDGCNYFTDGKTAWVKTGITLVAEDGKLEMIEELPVMNFKNESIPLSGITSFAVNKTIQRSLTKAAARHGLGLYIYAGEDIPNEATDMYPEIKVLSASAPAAPKGSAPKPDATTELSLIDKVDALIQSKMKPLTTEERKPYTAKIKSICGVVNYRNVTDEETLKKLYEAFAPNPEAA